MNASRTRSMRVDLANLFGYGACTLKRLLNVFRGTHLVADKWSSIPFHPAQASYQVSLIILQRTEGTRDRNAQTRLQSITQNIFPVLSLCVGKQEIWRRMWFWYDPVIVSEIRNSQNELDKTFKDHGSSKSHLHVWHWTPYKKNIPFKSSACLPNPDMIRLMRSFFLFKKFLFCRMPWIPLLVHGET